MNEALHVVRSLKEMAPGFKRQSPGFIRSWYEPDRFMVAEVSASKSNRSASSLCSYTVPEWLGPARPFELLHCEAREAYQRVRKGRHRLRI